MATLITENDIKDIITELSKERNAFWSEADFQYSFAWKLQQKYEGAKIRLEKRHNHSISRDLKSDSEAAQEDLQKEPYYVDIWVEMDNSIYPIELKYKTRAEVMPDVDGDNITLLNQSAQDLGRYGYIKDIKRIENIIEDYTEKEKTVQKGFAIMLTNDPSYYTIPSPNRPINSLDKMFRIHQGTVNKPNILQGELFWSDKQSNPITQTGHWTQKYPSLRLNGSYNIMWHLYKENTSLHYCVTTIH